MIITIDGTSGTGKTTVARRVADCLHLVYYDTGAMYRAVALALLRKKIELNNESELNQFFENFTFEIRGDGGAKRYFIYNEEVTREIRSLEVTQVASKIAAMRKVREFVWKMQRDYGAKGSAVFEGRDMGSIVFPNAEIKIFLSARPEVRALRRYDELKKKYPAEALKTNYESILKAIIERDHFDSTRELAPLICPENAFSIDTSELSIDLVVDKILEYKLKKFSEQKR